MSDQNKPAAKAAPQDMLTKLNQNNESANDKQDKVTQIIVRKTKQMKNGMTIPIMRKKKRR